VSKKQHWNNDDDDDDDDDNNNNNNFQCNIEAFGVEQYSFIHPNSKEKKKERNK
jgi:hypothetical protein